HEPDSYVHRIGRTGRAGASGIALSFCDVSERGLLRDIERLVRRPITVDAEHPFHARGSQGSASTNGGRELVTAGSRGGNYRGGSTGRSSSGQRRSSNGHGHSGTVQRSEGSRPAARKPHATAGKSAGLGRSRRSKYRQGL